MSLLEHALFYAEIGFFVLPCREKDEGEYVTKNGVVRKLFPKQPRYSGGVHIATRDKKQIQEWWKRNPESAIGINCGKSNLFVVDIDNHDVNGFENFMRMGISDEGSLQSVTPTGGIHIVFRGVGRTTSNKELGIDTRSKNGYIIAPPSFLFLDGKAMHYVATNDWRKEPAPIPDGLFEKLGITENKKKDVNKKTYPKRPRSKEIKKATDALNKLPRKFVENYKQWVLVGMALHELGDDGYSLWKEWSKKSDKYDEAVCEYTWNRMNPTEIGLGTLYHHANNN